MISEQNKIGTMYVIDDDDTYQFVIKRTIEATRLVQQIKIFSNGREAMSFLESVLEKPELLPEIILLDLTMPVMDGWNFLENYLLIKPRIGKKVIIYVVSSSINPVDVERAKNISEVTDYVVKPISKAKLIALLEKL
jgi:CheY-like chemotaxis protein